MRMAKTSTLLAGIALLAGCNAADSIAPPPSPPVQPPAGTVTHRGFDTSIYPGDAAMTAWKSGSPYKWSGFYLSAPCHKDASWSGKRALLSTLGWGIAVIFVGQQTFDGVPTILATRIGAVDLPDPISRATVSATCSRTLLTRDQGLVDADDAIAKTLAEGFPAGTVIFLDLEHMDVVTAAMESYYRAWAERVLAHGRYRPGVYVHKFNAPTVYAGYTAVYQAAGVASEPRFWLATATGFSLDKKPTDIGYAFANVWQGILDTNETWAGITLHIDVDIADRLSPSGPE